MASKLTVEMYILSGYKVCLKISVAVLLLLHLVHLKIEHEGKLLRIEKWAVLENDFTCVYTEACNELQQFSNALFYHIEARLKRLSLTVIALML